MSYYRKKDDPQTLLPEPLSLEIDGCIGFRSINGGHFRPEQLLAGGYYLDITITPVPDGLKFSGNFHWNEDDGTVMALTEPMTPEEIQAQRLAYCQQIKAAGKAYIESQIDPDGLILVNNLAQAGHQYGVENFAWGAAVRKEQMRREALVETGVEDFTEAMLDFSSFGEKPWTVEQMMMAAGV